MAKKRRRSRFGLGLFLYALLLILLCAAALGMLNRYLAVYEQTRPGTALAFYRSELLSPDSTEGCRAALDGLDERLRSREDSLALVHELLEGAHFSESLAEGSESEKHYRVIAGGSVLGEVTLRPTGDEQYGLRPWTAAEEHYDFSALFHGVSATVPPGYHVFVGEHELGSGELKERDIPYALLADAYPLIEGLPTMRRYESGLFLGELPLRVTDAKGREIPPEEQTEDRYLDNCGAEDRGAVEAYVESFLKPYVLFTANIEQDGERYFNQIFPLSKPGSPLRQRLMEGQDAAWWSWVRSCELLEQKVTGCIDLGDGRFLADIDYTTKVVAISDPVVESFSLRMVLENTDGRLLGSYLYNR